MYQITSGLRRITTFFSRPFATLRMRTMTMRPRMPLGLRTLGNSLRYQSRALNRFKLPGQKKPSDVPHVEPAEVGAKPAPRRRRRRSRRTAVAQEYAQVHLVRHSGERQVVHVGAAVGFQSIDLLLDDRPEVVTLRFTQDNAGLESTVRVSLMGGIGSIQVDQQTLDRRSAPVAINTGTRLAIDGHTYTCELFKADEMPQEIGLDVHWQTSSGLFHDVNEDAIGLGQSDDSALFVVADGVQGGYAGELVSAFAVQYLLLAFKKNVPHHFSWAQVLTRAFEKINEEVRRFSARSPDYAGTTLTALIVRGQTAHVAHVGDSRLYLLRQGRFRQLTTDHVVISRRIAIRGDKGAESVDKYPRLSRAIGKDDQIKPDVFTFGLQTGDRLLLCTDGATDALSGDALAGLLGTMTGASLPQELILRANKTELPDNTSALVLDVGSEPSGDFWWQAKPEPRVYKSDRVFTARLDHVGSYETVYRGLDRTNRRLPIVLWVVLVVLLILAVAALVSANRPEGVLLQKYADRQSAIGGATVGETLETTVSPAVTEMPAPTATSPVAYPTAYPTASPPPGAPTGAPTGVLPVTSTIRPPNQ